MKDRTLKPTDEKNRKRLIRLRETLGMRTSELASEIGKSKRQVEHYESGFTKVPPLVLRVVESVAKEQEAANA